jgi:hypothetical protein
LGTLCGLVSVKTEFFWELKEVQKMMLNRLLLVEVLFGLLVLISACSQTTPTPVTVVETVIVKETVPVEKVVEVVVTKEIEKPVEKIVTVEVEIEKEVMVVETVEVEKIVEVVETVEVVKEVTVKVPVTVTSTPTATVDPTNPKVKEVLNQITMVQHHHDRDTGLDSFTCVSRGLGLNGVEVDPEGAIYVGPNSMDFDLWGVVALFQINPDGSIFLVPQETGGRFVDPDGIEYRSLTRQEALSLFASGDAIWIGDHGEAGRVGECDPQYVTPTPTPD